VSATGLVSRLWRPAGRLRAVGWDDIALAAVLRLWAIGLVSGVFVAKPHNGVAAAIVVLAMTIPVAWERRAPLAAAAAVAVGAALKELLIEPMLRCGPGLAAGLELSASRVVEHLLLGGKLRIDTLPGRWAALVRLPLTADYARP